MRFLRSWLYPLRCCDLAVLSLNFLSVLEGAPHIVLAVDGHEIHRSTPEGCIEGIHQTGFGKGDKKCLNGCPAGLLAAETERFKDKLVGAGVDVTFRCFEGAIHGFTIITEKQAKKFPKNYEKSLVAWKMMTDFVNLRI